MWRPFGKEKGQTYYHVSPAYLPAGLILQPQRYIGDDNRILLVAQETLDMGDSSLRFLNLVNELISYRVRAADQAASNAIDFPTVLNEVILERVRERDFGDRPRRIGGVFLFPGINEAVRFRAEDREGAGVLAECSGESARIFEADMALVWPPDLRGDIQEELAQAEERARAYWCGDLGPEARVELVAEGEVEVVRILETAA